MATKDRRAVFNNHVQDLQERKEMIDEQKRLEKLQRIIASNKQRSGNKMK